MIYNSHGIKLKNNFYLENPDKKCWPDSPLKRLGLLNQGFNGIKYNLNSNKQKINYKSLNSIGDWAQSPFNNIFI